MKPKEIVPTDVAVGQKRTPHLTIVGEDVDPSPIEHYVRALRDDPQYGETVREIGLATVAAQANMEPDDLSRIVDADQAGQGGVVECRPFGSSWMAHGESAPAVRNAKAMNFWEKIVIKLRRTFLSFQAKRELRKIQANKPIRLW